MRTDRGLEAGPQLPSRSSLSCLPPDHRQEEQGRNLAVLGRARPGSQRRDDEGYKSPLGPQTQCHPHGFSFLFLILLLRLGNKKQIPAGASHAPWARRMRAGTYHIKMLPPLTFPFPLLSLCSLEHTPSSWLSSLALPGPHSQPCPARTLAACRAWPPQDCG